jgi:glycine/D-amino acid oxidase-like deaminating enzyme
MTSKGFAGDSYDAVVVGGGFYGCCAASLLRGRFRRVLLVETGSGLLTRASYRNQARVHNGYHYPRSFLTAVRSVINFPRFLADFASCVDSKFTKLYAIPRLGSKVNSRQFSEFCRRIEAPCRPARPAWVRLFDSASVEQVFEVQEYAFDASKLAAKMAERLRDSVEVRYQSRARAVTSAGGGMLEVELEGSASVRAQIVVNCTYSRINTLLRDSGLAVLPQKHEITELALVEPPLELQRAGVTVMDGPFFSTMPFPAEQLHSFSHVTYTPHESWKETDGARDPIDYLARLQPQSKFPLMQRDAQRFLPCVARARYVRSLFEVKSVLLRNEQDDGRPILFAHHDEVGNFYSVMGGKIDNVYDVLPALAQVAEGLQPSHVLTGCAV